MQTHPTHHLKSRGGSLTSQNGTPKDHLQEEEEDPRHVRPDHPPEAEVVEVAEEVEVAEVAEEEGVEHSHYPDTHLPNRQKNSWGTHPQYSQGIERR